MFDIDIDNIPVEVKKMICGKVLNYASRLLWLDELKIEYRESVFFSNPHIDAIFVKEYFLIFINVEWLERAEFFDLVSCVLHETRHAYQYAQVEFKDYMEYKESDEIIALWKNEFESYKPSTGNIHNDADYIQQAIEIDAIAFEKVMMKDLLDADIVAHELIRDEVDRVKIVLNETQLH